MYEYVCMGVSVCLCMLVCVCVYCPGLLYKLSVPVKNFIKYSGYCSNDPADRSLDRYPVSKSTSATC